MIGFFNKNLWKSAYLLEFRQGSIVEEAFTFSVPVQSEELNYAQRIAETKTFGGSVFEDYGNDSVKITLSGSTINQELRTIHRADKAVKEFTGEGEIFYLKNIIEKYGQFKKIKNKEIYLYALTDGNDASKKTHAELGENPKCWRVWIEALDIRRSKEKPFAYDYTLRLIGLPPNAISKKSNLNSKFEWIQKAIDTIGKIKNTISEWKGYIKDVFDKFENIKLVMNDIVVLTDSIQSVLYELESVSNFAIENSKNFIEETNAFGNKLKDTAISTVEIGSNLINETKDLVNSVYNIKTQLYDEVFTTKNNVFVYVCAKFNISLEDFKDAYENYNSKIRADAEKLYDYSLKINKPNTSINPNGEDGNDEIVNVGNPIEYTTKDGDTWASIAHQFLGDTTLGKLIQFYNPDVEELGPGTIIYIPTINENENTEVKSDSKKNFFGQDIKINNGDFYIQNNDFVLTNGVETVNQGISNRLNTAINSRVRNIVYGIKNTSGLSVNTIETAEAYVSASIRQTILQDPRVESIESLTFVGAGEKLQVNVTYVTRTGLKEVYKEVI